MYVNAKKEEKNVVTGHEAAPRGASKKRIFVKFDNWCEKVKFFGEWLKKVVKNFGGRMGNIFKILVGTGHPTASARHYHLDPSLWPVTP